MTNWKYVESSMIDAFRYSEPNQALEVMFKNGSIYQYFDVPPAVFEQFSSASIEGSYGKSFNGFIRGHYRYARL